MRLAACLALLAAPALAQEVADCAAPPTLAALVEPWEESIRVLAEGAVRLALVEAGEGSVALVVLTLPPAPAPAEPDPAADPAAAEAPEPGPPSPRRCRLIAEGGLGFAGLDLGALETAEDPEAATFAARIPALRFVPESSELEEVTLALTFGVADGALAAAVEEGP